MVGDNVVIPVIRRVLWRVTICPGTVLPTEVSPLKIACPVSNGRVFVELTVLVAVVSNNDSVVSAGDIPTKGGAGGEGGGGRLIVGPMLTV